MMTRQMQLFFIFLLFIPSFLRERGEISSRRDLLKDHVSLFIGRDWLGKKGREDGGGVWL